MSNRYMLRARFSQETGLHYSHELFIPWLEREEQRLLKSQGKRKPVKPTTPET